MAAETPDLCNQTCELVLLADRGRPHQLLNASELAWTHFMFVMQPFDNLGCFVGAQPQLREQQLRRPRSLSLCGVPNRHHNVFPKGRKCDLQCRDSGMVARIQHPADVFFIAAE